MQEFKKIFKNKNLLLAGLIFQLILLLDAFTILYVVFIEDNVSFSASLNNMEGIVAVVTLFTVTFLLNFVFILLAFSRLRTTTIYIPFGIITFIVVYIIFSSGIFTTDIAPLFAGIILGIFYAFVFYGPAIWAYFRFRLPFIAVGWLSIVYLVSLLVASASNISFEDNAATALIRIDYLILTGIFYLLISLLLILDNSQALARWKRLPHQHIKLPLKTIVPIILILFIVTVISNVLSPFLWKALWQNSDQNQIQDKVTSNDLPENTEQGPAGNMQLNDDGTIEMDPNQKLQDSLDISKTQGKVVFLVNVDNASSRERLRPFYWKMENLDSYDKKNGFYNDFSFETKGFDENLAIGNLVYFDYSYIPNSDELDQDIFFIDLKTNWVIGHQSQFEIELLTGKDRKLAFFDNGTAVTEKNKPFAKGDSYTIWSDVSNLKSDQYSWELQVDAIDTRFETSFDKTNRLAIERQYTGFFDQEISDLARQIANGETNRLLVAQKIQKYFLDNFTYSLNPGAPDSMHAETENMDRLKYFLFTNKQGYCTYFASAMTMLLQSLDIPARTVGGFAEGKYNSELNAYVVTADYAHAWVEVYFNDYGWIIFDPTPTSIQEEQRRDNALNDTLADQKQISELKEIKKNPQSQKPVVSPDEPQLDMPFNFDVEKFLPLIRMLFWSICCSTFLAVLILPPGINLLIDQHLAGRIFKKDERQQIINLYRLLQRRLRKLNPSLNRANNETAIQYAKRINQQLNSQNQLLAQHLEKSSIIYNRAAYRFELARDDLINMQQHSSLILEWVDQKMGPWEHIKALWWK